MLIGQIRPCIFPGSDILALRLDVTMGEDWAYMDSLRPPVYICLRRKVSDTAGYEPMALDGRYVVVHLPLRRW